MKINLQTDYLPSFSTTTSNGKTLFFSETNKFLVKRANSGSLEYIFISFSFSAVLVIDINALAACFSRTRSSKAFGMPKIWIHIITLKIFIIFEFQDKFERIYFSFRVQ